jgi:predicted membrane protein
MAHNRRKHMNSNNSKPEGSTGTELLEPPETLARITPEAQAGMAAPPPAASTYGRYPQPGETAYPSTDYRPLQQPPARQGVSPLAVILIILGAVLLLGLVFVVATVLMVSNIVGQVTNPAVGELRTETQSVALGEASSVVADVSIGVGKLDISGGATDLMNATFNYNIAAWKPVVSYDVKGTEGTLLVQQPSQGAISTSPNTRYDWDLRFKNDVPVTMKVDIGVGEGNLRFAGLDLRRLEVNSGVGDTTLDLTSLNTQQDVSVLVKGGVGQVTITLPTDTGVRVTADGGLGNINANGLTVNGNTFTNTAYGTTPTTINIDVKTGIGNIQLVQGR